MFTQNSTSLQQNFVFEPILFGMIHVAYIYEDHEQATVKRSLYQCIQI